MKVVLVAPPIVDTLEGRLQVVGVDAIRECPPLGIYVLVSLLARGLMTQPELAGLKVPSMAGVLESAVGGYAKGAPVRVIGNSTTGRPAAAITAAVRSRTYCGRRWLSNVSPASNTTSAFIERAAFRTHAKPAVPSPPWRRAV